MAEENAMDELTEEIDQDASESGIILNFQQIQSIDIPQQFKRVNTDNGWIVNILGSGRVVVNFITSMRKLETPLMSGDTIERDVDNIVITKNQAADAYKTQRGTTSLARTREELLSAESTVGRQTNPD